MARVKQMVKGGQRKRSIGQAGAGNDRFPSLDELRKLHGEPLPPARPIGAKPAKADLQRLYAREEKTIREIAAALGCSRDMVHRALKEYGIKARPVARRSRLQDIPLKKIEAEIAVHGLRGAARAFGMDHSTLAQHVKARRSLG